MLRKFGTNKKSLVIVPVALALALTWLFLPVKNVSVEPYGTLSLESRVVITTGYEAAYASPGTIGQDTFTEASETFLEAHTPDTGTGWQVVTAETWVVSSAAADTANEKSGSTNFAKMNDDIGSAEMDISITVYNNKNDDDGTLGGPMGALPAGDIATTANQDGYVAVIVGQKTGSPKSFRLKLYRVDDGALTLLSTEYDTGSVDPAAVWTVKLQLRTSSPRQEVFLDGTSRITADDTTYTGQYAGIVGQQADCQLDNFLSEDVAVPPDISNLPTSIDFGNVTTDTDYWSSGSAPTWGLDDGECHFTVTNNSSQAVNIDIRSTDFTGGTPGWTLTSGAPGTDTVRLRAGASGTTAEGNMFILTTSDQANFISSLAASTSKMWELKMETPAVFSNGDPKSATITLTATF